MNLALRQAGHYLLLEQNDSTSTIAPVQYHGSYGFLLPLECVFNYDTLPVLLKQAFEDYGISEPYELVVQSCEEGIPFLGYNQAALDRGNVPCVGREQTATCANIFVQFRMQDHSDSKPISAIAWLFIPFMAVLGFLFFKKVAFRPADDPTNGQFLLGQYCFDPKNQVLMTGGRRNHLNLPRK